MNQVKCPLDGKPCERDCPDRYQDRPEGGCFLTIAQSMGAQILDLGGGSVGMLFMPEDKEKAAPGATNTKSGKQTQ